MYRGTGTGGRDAEGWVGTRIQEQHRKIMNRVSNRTGVQPGVQKAENHNYDPRTNEMAVMLGENSLSQGRTKTTARNPTRRSNRRQSTRTAQRWWCTVHCCALTCTIFRCVKENDPLLRLINPSKHPSKQSYKGTKIYRRWNRRSHLSSTGTGLHN